MFKKNILILVLLVILNSWFFYMLSENTDSEKKTTSLIDKIKSETVVEKQKPYVISLLEAYGAEKTQELLFASGLAFTGETHLLVHTIGEYIYKNHYGELRLCKDYFLSACYHAYIISDLADHGLEGVAQTVSQCEKSGDAVLAQCSHAAGHGFLAWVDYDIPKALNLCDEINKKFASIPTFNCYDGVFMENIYGVHEGSPSPKRWVRQDDDFYPCNDDRILDKYTLGCWANQATLLYIRYGQDLQKVASVCDSIKNPEHEKMCFHNFARQIHPLTYGDTKKGFELCKNAQDKKWINFCLSVLASSAYSVGDRDKMPYEICELINKDSKIECYNQLYSAINAYSKDSSEKTNQCNKIKDFDFIQKCISN